MQTKGLKAGELLQLGSGREAFIKSPPYLLPNLLFHLDGGAKLGHLTDALAGIAAVLPQYVASGVRAADQSRPVIGTS